MCVASNQAQASGLSPEKQEGQLNTLFHRCIKIAREASWYICGLVSYGKVAGYGDRHLLLQLTELQCLGSGTQI